MAVASLRAESACANTPIDGDALLLDALRRWKAAVIRYREDDRCGDTPEWEQLLQDADDIVSEIAGIQASGLDGIAIKFYLSIEHDIGMTGNHDFALAWHIAGDRLASIGQPALCDAMRLAPAIAEILEISTPG